jgi:four helix bundle protein
MLPHEKLEVYGLTVEFDAVVFGAMRGRGDADGDQLLRASGAVQNNIAEGASERRPAEKARIYRIARREASECAATLSRIQHRDPLDVLTFNRAQSLIRRVIRMLTKLIDRHESAVG